MNCLNPGCGKPFTPRAQNRRRQKVCGAVACKRWYKAYWTQTSDTPRGMLPEQWEKVEKELTPGSMVDTLIVTGRETGLRLGELLGLRWEDVLEGKKLRETWIIRGQRDERNRFKVPKTKRARHGYPSDKALKWIGSLKKADGRSPQEWVFPLSHGWAWEYWTVFQKSLGITNPDTGQAYRFHDLRHTLGVELVGKGALKEAQEALGHTRIETTMRYSRRRPEQTRDAIAAARRKK